MKINIIGAGMAGLLAANMLRRHEVTVYEKQEKLPNNHHAVLRFRTSKVGELLGIPFRQVMMMKTYLRVENPVADSLSYSKKCTGLYKSDRSIFDLASGSHIDVRYVAPPNLVEQMSKNINIKYGEQSSFDKELPTISTVPMPELMKVLNYPNYIKFENIPGIVITANVIGCDAYVSVYFPGPELYSRASITGDQIMIEFPNVFEIPAEFHLETVFRQLGVSDSLVTNVQKRNQDYFKITEIPDSDRKRFQRWASVNHNIFSLGRYATWRPKLLLDDLIEDVNNIEKWIVGGNK
jgi:hypothetical protein